MARADYEQLWRPCPEVWAVGGWVAASIGSLFYAYMANLGWTITLLFTGLALILAAFRATQVVRLWVTKTRLIARRLDFITLDELEKVVTAVNRDGGDGGIFLGDGFEVEQKHVQRWYDLRRVAVHEVTPPEWAMQLIAKHCGLVIGEDRGSNNGGWMDAVEEKRRPIILPMSAQAGHMITVGTTGSGKTTALVTFAMQRVKMKHVLLVIDPKGAHDVERALREVARRENVPFVLFDPSRPSESDRISLLANFNRFTEIPSRIVSTLGDSDFKAFGWCFTSRFVAAMLMVGEKPDLASIKSYIVGGNQLAGELLERCLIVWLRQQKQDPDSIINTPDPEGGKPKSKLEKLHGAYRRFSKQFGTDDVIDGLISTYSHDKEHYQKVTLNLVPILEKLTAGELRHLFSPDPLDMDDLRPMWDFESIVEQRAVVYARLDSLSDSEVGSTIGSMMLSNIVAVAGARQNSGKAEARVSVIIDEAAEVANVPTIQVANKGRSALFDLLLFCQTIQDLTVRFGSQPMRDMVLGNANNMMAFRINDAETSKFALQRLGKSTIKEVKYSQSLNQKTDDNALHFSGGVSRSISDKEVDIMPADLLNKLPNLHYLAAFAGGRVVKGTIPILKLS